MIGQVVTTYEDVHPAKVLIVDSSIDKIDNTMSNRQERKSGQDSEEEAGSDEYEFESTIQSCIDPHNRIPGPI